jgi:hypothetical protein
MRVHSDQSRFGLSGSPSQFRDPQAWPVKPGHDDLDLIPIDPVDALADRQGRVMALGGLHTAEPIAEMGRAPLRARTSRLLDARPTGSSPFWQPPSSIRNERHTGGSSPVYGEVATPDAIRGSRRGQGAVRCSLHHARMVPLPRCCGEERAMLASRAPTSCPRLTRASLGWPGQARP